MDGETIRALRRRLGVTQRQLAERLDVDQGTVSRWERGIENPRPARLANLRSLLVREEDRRHLDRSIAVVRHDLMPSTLMNGSLRLAETSCSGERFYQLRGRDPSKLLGLSLGQYLDRIGLPELERFSREAGLLQGGALLFRFTVNSRGKGNTTIWEPLFEEGRVVGVLNYIVKEFSFGDNPEHTLEQVDFVPVEDPGSLVVLHRGMRAHEIDG